MTDRFFATAEASVRTASTLATEQREILLAVTRAIATSDFESLRQCFTEDIELHIHGFPSIAGSWRGRDEVIPAIASNFGKISEQRPEVESTIQQGNTVAMLFRETGRFKSDRRRYQARGILWYTFEGNQIKRVEEFMHIVSLG